MDQIVDNQLYTFEKLGRDIDAVVSRTDDQRAIVAAVEPLLTRFLSSASDATIPHEYCTENETSAGEREDLTPDQQIMRKVKVSRMYRGVDNKYVIMLTVWPVGCRTGAHDHHGTWVVEGGYLDRLLIRKYKRLDDGSKPGFAELKEVETTVMGPGDVGHVFSPGREIHEVSNPYDAPAITVNIYGSPDPVNEACDYFDTESNTVRTFAPFNVPYFNEATAG